MVREISTWRLEMSQSVISAYESDRREPGLRTLAKLIEATGHQLCFELIPVRRRCARWRVRGSAI